MIESLLAKPSTKPDFKQGVQGLLAGSSILNKARAFMPEFVAETDRILSDPASFPSKQMDIVITEHPETAVSVPESDAPPIVVGKPG